VVQVVENLPSKYEAVNSSLKYHHSKKKNGKDVVPLLNDVVYSKNH
jgi:hypothetical protein